MQVKNPHLESFQNRPRFTARLAIIFHAPDLTLCVTLQEYPGASLYIMADETGEPIAYLSDADGQIIASHYILTGHITYLLTHYIQLENDEIKVLSVLSIGFYWS